MLTWYFIVTFYFASGEQARYAHQGYSSVEVCEVVMKREVEAALHLLRPYKLRGIATTVCQPGKPLLG
jgi:hypothetical protein